MPQFMVDSAASMAAMLVLYLIFQDSGERWSYKTMIWMQDGTVSVGHTLLDVTTNPHEYYYQAAEKAADAIIWGRARKGWKLYDDFAGDRSLIKWYATVGKKRVAARRVQHYYGINTMMTT